MSETSINPSPFASPTPAAPQTPHSSTTAPPFGIPAQSEHDELSPSHTPHASATRLSTYIPKSLVVPPSPVVTVKLVPLHPG